MIQSLSQYILPRRSRVGPPWHAVPYPSWKHEHHRGGPQNLQTQAETLRMIATALRLEALRLLALR